MVIESSITCSKVDGLKGHQEKFNDNSGVDVPGLCATSNGGEEQADPNDETMTRVLPFSNDLVQMNWAIDLTKRAYIDTIEHKLNQFNNAVENGHIPGEKIKLEDMPQQPLPCMGFPISLLPDDTRVAKVVRFLMLEKNETLHPQRALHSVCIRRVITLLMHCGVVRAPTLKAL